VTGGGSVTIHVTHGGKEEKGGTMCKLCDMFLVSYCKHTASKQLAVSPCYATAAKKKLPKITPGMNANLPISDG
jgi:hypothetical protein